MIILNTSQFQLNPNSIKELFIVYCNKELSQLLNSKSKDLRTILERYSIEDIKNALNAMLIDENGDLVVPEHSVSSVILRELEFGSADSNALHILSKTKKRMSIKEDKRYVL